MFTILSCQFFEAQVNVRCGVDHPTEKTSRLVYLLFLSED